jgi:uncharacterized damage-inducible protein DinB
MNVNIDPQVIQSHLAYTRWASEKLLAACDSLTPEQIVRDFGTANHSIEGTLLHVFFADRIWLWRMNPVGGIPLPKPEESGITFLGAAGPAVFDAWDAFGQKWTEQDLDEAVNYQTLNGTLYSTPRWQIVLHVVNHGTHHRGQVAGFLRSMGVAPPQLDLAAFYREAAGK